MKTPSLAGGGGGLGSIIMEIRMSMMATDPISRVNNQFIITYY